MISNHDKFMEQVMALGSKNKQLDLLKAYMLRLPTQEFDAFLFGNLDKLDIGLQELLSSKDLSDNDHTYLEQEIDNIIQVCQTNKEDFILEKRKAA